MATTAGGGVVIGLLGAGVVYLLAKGKEKADQLAELEQGPLEQPAQPGPPGREGHAGRPPRRGPPGAPPPAPTMQNTQQPPPGQNFPHGHPLRQAPAPAYPPQRPWSPASPPSYPSSQRPYMPPPVRHAGGSPSRIPGPPWVRATQADVARDGASDWYASLLNAVLRPGYSEERTIGGRHWKFMVVSAAAHPELTSRVRDVIGWVIPGPSHPVQAHGAYPPAPYPSALHARPPAPSPLPVAYHPAPQDPYGPAPSGGAPPWQPYAQQPHHHEHPHDQASHPAMNFAVPAPGGDCQNWQPATDADVHQDGVASVYQSMLPLPETTPPRIEVHKGRTWKFQVVTPTSDPSFGFAPGVKKSVRGWICADAPRPDTSDPGY
jgi:hypothetical protein